MYSTKFFPFQIAYLTVILVEPELIDRDAFYEIIKERKDCGGLLQKITASRRSSWSSKEDALEYFDKRAPWNAWDARVLRIYVVRQQHWSGNLISELQGRLF
jgi:hypothetical protein